MYCKLGANTAMRKSYKKPKITEKKVKMSMFFRNRFINSATSFKFPLLAAVVCSSCSCISCTCFLKGTKILMADGTAQAIETIKKGDKVFSYNLEQKKLVENRAVELIIHKKATDGYLIINKILKVTPEHAVFINGNWQPVDSVKIGDSVINSSGEETVIQSAQRVNEEVGPVYNLHLENEEHNYFAEGILVHNVKYPCLAASTKIATPFGDKNIKEIRKGQLIWTINNKGERVAAPVVRISKTAVPTTHQVCCLVLEDGRELFVSLYHPTAIGGSLYDLQVGQEYDGSIIVFLGLIPYKKRYTYDLLPESDTGYYWASDILMGSTLAPSVFEENISIHA